MAPSSLRRGPAVKELRPRITTLGDGRGGCRICRCFYLRAFCFARKGYAASVGRQSRRRLRSRYVLPRRLPRFCVARFCGFFCADVL